MKSTKNSPATPLTGTPAKSDPAKLELLLLTILTISSKTDYCPSNGVFTKGQDILDKIAADYNALRNPTGTGQNWNWDACKAAAVTSKVDLSKTYADSIFALGTTAYTIANQAFQPAAAEAPGWSVGPPAHPSIGETLSILAM